MDVFSTEQGVRLSFVKISEFRGGFEPPKPPPPSRYATGLHTTLYHGNLKYYVFRLCKTIIIRLSSSEVHEEEIVCIVFAFMFGCSAVAEPGSGLEYDMIEKRPVSPDIKGNTTQL
jgi:hypothetical protein